MKNSTLKKAKLYWGRAANLREQIAIDKASDRETARLTKLAAKYHALSRSLFDSLLSSKTTALNIAKSKEAAAARERIRCPGALTPAPTNSWVIVKKDYH